MGITDPDYVAQPLRNLYKRHSSYLVPQQPAVQDLEATTIEVLGTTETQTFLILDAFDEISETERPDVVDFLLNLASAQIVNLHVLVVTRPLPFLRRLRVQANERWTFETIPKCEVRNDIVRLVDDEMERTENLDLLEPELKSLGKQKLAGSENDQQAITPLPSQIMLIL